ncbi:hypothetical protein, partial [Vibrio anguillarum]|uniref:hypothetical protein n=1 Tax=Vibrio anguillarum TaxID=55601 RepID=UPI001BE426ED
SSSISTGVLPIHRKFLIVSFRNLGLGTAIANLIMHKSVYETLFFLVFIFHSISSQRMTLT